MKRGNVVALGIVCMLILGTARAEKEPVNIATQDVKPIQRSGDPTDPPLLLVLVVDQDGIPMEGAEITVIYSNGIKGNTSTIKDGTALMRMTDSGKLTLRASAKGYIPSEARNVTVGKNALTAVALPLQQATP